MVTYFSRRACAIKLPIDAQPRRKVTAKIGATRFAEVFFDTPLGVCEQRGAKARRGRIENFTGVSDPYEVTRNPGIVLGTVNHRPEENAILIVRRPTEDGFVRSRPSPPLPNGRTFYVPAPADELALTIQSPRRP